MQLIKREMLRWLLPAVLVTGVWAPSVSAADIDFTKLGDFNGDLRNQGIEELGAGGSHVQPALPAPAAMTLEITVLNVSPTVISRYTRPAVDAVLRNIGKKPIFLPSSMNDLEVLRNGNQDRAFLAVYLRLLHRGTGKYTNYSVGVAVGSASVPGSMIRLDPGETLFIHGVGEPSEAWMPDSAGFTQPEAGVVDAKLIVVKKNLDDSRRVVRSREEASNPDATISLLWNPRE